LQSIGFLVTQPLRSFEIALLGRLQGSPSILERKRGYQLGYLREAGNGRREHLIFTKLN
jgi:hypothetical protein